MLNVELETRMAIRIQDRAFDFACRIARLYDHLQKRRGVGRAVSRQLLKAATSVGANLEEASAGQSKADFISKCSIAAKEVREAHYWLRLLAATASVPEGQIRPLVDEANELVSILTVIVRNSAQSESRGEPIQHSTFNIQHSDPNEP